MRTYGETFSALLKGRPRRATHGDYFGEADARERLHFEPGTSTDIGFVTLVGVKFALDLLNLESEAYTPRVLNDYTPYTLICNTNRPEIGGENAKSSRTRCTSAAPFARRVKHDGHGRAHGLPAAA